MTSTRGHSAQAAKQPSPTTARLGDQAMRTWPLRLGHDNQLYRYNGKTYERLIDGSAWMLQDLIGDAWSTHRVREVDAWLRTTLRREELLLHEAPVADLLPLENVLLNVRTGEHFDHTPAEPAWVLLPVKWDKDATCPQFDKWLRDRCGDQAEDLLEAAGMMLLPSWPQRRAVFLFGPSRSGKSTMLRILKAIVGKPATTNVSLSDMDPKNPNRFRLALLHGKLLNVAPDLSDTRIRDLSIFKQLTGGDTVTAERKYENGFDFDSHVLHAFSANTLPEVAEHSSAFMNRVVPVHFPHTFEGDEKPDIEKQLLEELPGILVRLVEGVHRFIERGKYPELDPKVVGAFSAGVDPVALFVSEATMETTGGFLSTTQAREAYEEWLEMSGHRHKLVLRKFLEKCDTHLATPRVQGQRSQRGWRDHALRPRSEWGLEPSDRPTPPPTPGTLCRSCQVRPRLDLEDECLECLTGGAS